MDSVTVRMDTRPFFFPRSLPGRPLAKVSGDSIIEALPVARYEAKFHRIISRCLQYTYILVVRPGQLMHFSFGRESKPNATKVAIHRESTPILSDENENEIFATVSVKFSLCFCCYLD